MTMTRDDAYERMMAHRERELVKCERRIVELEVALTNLMKKSADHIIAGHPINSDALAALREAERLLTNR
jgi:hypothetical protein